VKKVRWRWIVAAALSLFAAVGLEASEGGERLRSLQQVCIADQATGFNWENGRWVRTQFKEKTYVVSKIDPPKDLAQAENSGRLYEFLACRAVGEELEGDDNHKFFNTCLMVHTMGEKNPRYMGCTEVHRRDEATGTWVVWIACGDSNFYFEPNGNFHLGTIHGFVGAKPKDDYKDSLVISVGRCAGLGGEAADRNNSSERGVEREG